MTYKLLTSIVGIVTFGWMSLFGESLSTHREFVGCIEDPDDLYRLACFEKTNSVCELQHHSGILRGVINVVTAPAELLRSPLVEHDQCVELGVGNTVARFINGLIEMSTLGYLEPTIYQSDFPDYVWESKWSKQCPNREEITEGVAFMAAEKAAKKGHAKAQHLIGDLYYKANPDAERNRSMAIKWYERAVRNGDVSAKKALLSVRGF